MKRRTIAVASIGLTMAASLAGLAIRGVDARQRAASATPTASRGKAIYDAHCVECHGTSGQGDGPAAMTLMPHPRDFTSGRYKLRSTETGSLPTDDDLLRSVRQGLYGTAMPGWQPILPDEDIRAVVGYIKTFSPRFAAESPEPVIASPAVPPSTESTRRGAAVYATLQCGKCHGDDGRGTNAVTRSFEDDWGYPLQASDLTEPWTFRGGDTPADVYMRFRAGMSGTPMPSYTGSATETEMWDLANYVGSLRRKPVWEMTAGEVAAFYRQQEQEALADPVRRGEYLVNAMACPVCHSPVDEERRMLPGLWMAGGLRMHLAPWGTYPTGNLTSDKETGLGSWTDDEIKRAITKGILEDGSRLLPFPMDWSSFSTLKPSDLDAIVAYLRTIPPVRNRVPKPSRAFLPVYLWGKFTMLVLREDPPTHFYAGNSGMTTRAR